MSSETLESNAGQAWSILRAGRRESTGVEIPTIPSGVMAPAGATRLALGERGEPRLLLPLDPGETARDFAEAPSLRILVSSYVTDGKATRYVDLTCMVPELESVFSEVTAQILARVASGQACAAAARSTILDFRRLLLRSASVAPTMITGLIGELLLLRRLLDRSSKAWRTWRGPLGDRHDFRSGDHSLEVKTSPKASQNVTVSSIDQMAAPARGSLHLLHVLLEQTSGGLLSVSALGQAVLAGADEPDQVGDRLAAIGCSDVNSPTWNSIAFRLEAERLYQVVDGFPRLVPSMVPGGSLPVGVTDLTYRIDLAAASAFRLDPGEIDILENKLITCLSQH